MSISILAIKLPSTGTAPDILDHLLFGFPSTPPSTIRVFWDLDDTVSHIQSLIQSVIPNHKITKYHSRWGEYRFYYIPGKLFSVSKSGIEATYYELSQYFPGDPEPPTITELQQKADLLADTLTRVGITSTTTLSSPVAIAEASGLLEKYSDTLTAIPTVWNTPEHALGAFEYAAQATAREWVSNYQVGCWLDGDDPLYSYDIASAYPHQASRLISLADCEIWKSDTYGSHEQGAYYGFVYGDLYIDPSHPYAFCSPVLARLDDGSLVNAVGHLPRDFYSLDLIRFVDRYSMGEFKMGLGCFLKPYGGVRPRFPFQEMMTDLFAKRSISVTASYVVKRIMNGVVGKLLEVRYDRDGNITQYGSLYNSIYHGIILSRTAIQVAEFIIEKGIRQSELVHVGVDGVKSTKYLPIPNISHMGRWRGTGAELTVIVSPAGIYTPNRSPQGIQLPLLLALLEAHPQSHWYSLDGWEMDLATLFTRQNRVFDKLPRTGSALLSGKYESQSIILGS